MAKIAKAPGKGVQSRYINLGFPTMMRKARWAATAVSNKDWRGLDAIIYSALAVEAFVNDFGTMATLIESKGRVPAIRIAVKALERTEKKRKPTMDKVVAVARRLSGQKPDQGAALLQQLPLLLDLQTTSVHSRAGHSRRTGSRGRDSKAARTCACPRRTRAEKPATAERLALHAGYVARRGPLGIGIRPECCALD